MPSSSRFSGGHRSASLFVTTLLLLASMALNSGCGSGNAPGTVSRDLLVGSADNGVIARFDGETGAYKGVFTQGGQLQSPNGMAVAPNGDLIVDDYVTHKVLRYGPDGAYKATLATTQGIPYGLTVASNGDIYVSDHTAPDADDGGMGTGLIERIPASTGKMEVFAMGGQLNGPDGVIFGPDGMLYVSSQHTKEVLKYNPTTGAFLGVFASGGGLGQESDGPAGLLFTNGYLYVADHGIHAQHHIGGRVLRYNGANGSFLTEFAPYHSQGLEGPLGMLAAPNGDVLVISVDTNNVLRFDRNTGAPKGVFAAAPDGLLHEPIYMTYTNAR